MTLLEFMAGVLLFLLLMLLSYHAFDAQIRLLRNIRSRTEPEQESNYRLLLIKHFLERSSQRLRGDPFLEGAKIFFPDLSFGKSPQKNAFSVAHVTGVPFPFIRSGFHYKLEAAARVQSEKTYLVAGSDAGGNFAWNYARAEQVVASAQSILARLEPYTSNSEVQTGSLVEVEIHGFCFQNQTLYRVSPGGALQPYLPDLDSFEYIWNEPLLTVRWKNGTIDTEFRCIL